MNPKLGIPGTDGPLHYSSEPASGNHRFPVRKGGKAMSEPNPFDDQPEDEKDGGVKDSSYEGEFPEKDEPARLIWRSPQPVRADG